MDLRARILKHCQRGMPVCATPYAAWARQLGTDEATLLATLGAMRAAGELTRVGPVFSPNRVGASCLAAFAVPPADIATAAALVSAHPGVNHNYLREHHYNLWFVLHAPDPAARDAALAALHRQVGHPLIRLPLLRAFHIDLGFDLVTGTRWLADERDAPPALALTPQQAAWLAAMQAGLPLVPRPYHAICSHAGGAPAELERTLAAWLAAGVVKRVGAVVQHRALGFTANAMLAFDVPDPAVEAAGQWLRAQAGVHLFYQRQRDLPAWRYNLFCMVHGCARAETEARVTALCQAAPLAAYASCVLFSTEAYKQTGAHNGWRAGDERRIHSA